MRIPEHYERIRSTLVQTMFVGRRESPTGVRYFGENIEQPAQPVVLEPQGAPDPVRQSMFAGEGRAPGQGFADVPVALHLNIAGILGVMEDSFLAGKVNPAPQWTRVRQGRADGGQLPFQERQNIDPGFAAPYGNRVAVQNTPRIPSIQSVAFGGLTYDGIRRRV